MFVKTERFSEFCMLLISSYVFVA